MSQFVQLVLLVGLLMMAPSREREPVTIPATDDPISAAGEVRLRKLHLVRPDLIPYPISFEVYA